MSSKSTPSTIKLDELVLDKNNPRFAELYTGSDNESELIEYLLYDESAHELAKAISDAGEFYPDRPLWVLKEKGHYLVKDGNRRCAAVKALRLPTKYQLDQPKTSLTELPVLIYHNAEDINDRIRQEHTSNLFKQWGRIAKALEIHRLYSSGNSIDSLKEYDSTPVPLYKLASFYYEAVKVEGDDLKKLLRTGRGKTGGKTIIFERLFRYKDKCGYSFRNKPSYEVVVQNSKQFKSYISALVQYLIDNPDTKTQDVDNDKEKFLKRLAPYGFKPLSRSSKNTKSKEGDTSSTSDDSNANGNSTSSTSDSSITNIPAGKSKKKSVKHKPIYQRKKIPAALEKLIQECFDLSQDNFPNAKIALARVTFECTLKFVIEKTSHNNKRPMSVNNYFRFAFHDKKGRKLPRTDFDKLRNLFLELIKETGMKEAFRSFELDHMHQIIHNYNVGGVPGTAKALCDNLIPIIEFLLQDESDLLDSLELGKLS